MRQPTNHANIKIRLNAHVFDVRAGVDSDDVSVLHAQVVADNPVDACAAIIEVVVGENDEDSVLALLALDEDRVATEELERLHGVVRKRDDRVVIVGSVGDTMALSVHRCQALSSLVRTSESLASSSS